MSGGMVSTKIEMDLLAYLRKPGFRRLWPSAREKLMRLNRVGGRVELRQLEADEREALEGLLAVNLYGKSSVQVDLKTLNQALLQTRFGVSLEDCLALIYPGVVLNRSAKREADDAEWEAFCAWAAGAAHDRKLRAWVSGLAVGAGEGYRAFRQCLEEFRATRQCGAWTDALRALALALGRRESSAVSGGRAAAIRLPVFAANATGNPHGLDRSTLCGRLFFWGLVALDGDRAVTGADYASESSPADEADFQSRSDPADEANRIDLDSDSLRSLYGRFGISLDDISSIVWAAGWPGVAVAPAAVTLWAVDRMPKTACPSKVFVVENPSIFGTLIDCADGRELPHPLICTSGQPALAALKLLDAAAEAGSDIYYSGDFDVNGLQMCAQLAARYQDRFVPWRMDCRDYFGVHRKGLPVLSDREKDRLAEMILPWEGAGGPAQGLAHQMAERGMKVFQEHLVEALCEDYWGRNAPLGSLVRF